MRFRVRVVVVAGMLAAGCGVSESERADGGRRDGSADGAGDPARDGGASPNLDADDASTPAADVSTDPTPDDAHADAAEPDEPGYEPDAMPDLPIDPPPDSAPAMPPDTAPAQEDTAAPEPDVPLPIDAGPDSPLMCGSPGAPCPTIDPFCTTDTLDPTESVGSLVANPMQDYVPLCAGWILLGDRQANQIVLQNAFTGETRKSYQLGAAPNDLEFDRDRGVLYVGLDAATSMARVDLTTDTVASLPLSAAVEDLALGSGGTLFAVLQDTQVSPRRPIVIIDTTSFTVRKQLIDDFGDLIVHDRPGQQLIVANTGLSPSRISRWAFDPVALTLTLTQSRQAGSNGQDLAISPDHTRLAYPNGAGNGTPPYTIFDLGSTDLNTVRGAWNTGPYPRSAEFSPDGTRLLATNGGALIVFDILTHVELVRMTPTLISCNLQLTEVGWSPSGRYAFAVSPCAIDGESSVLIWFRP